MVLVKSIDDVIENRVLDVNNYLRRNESIKNINDDYTVEIYLNDLLVYSKDIYNAEDMISSYLEFYKRLLKDNLNANNIESFEKAIKKSDVFKVLSGSSEVINIYSLVKVLGEDLSNYKSLELDTYIYKKNKRKEDLLRYLSSKNLKEEQKQYLLNIFEESEVYSKSLDCVLENLKEDIIGLICRFDLKDLINDNGYTLIDLINKDLSEEILNLIDKENEVYRLYEDVISVIKLDFGYGIIFCGDIIKKIKYNIEFSF